MMLTRITVIDGEVLRLKTCAECGREGLCTLDERSAFHSARRNPDGSVWYQARCKDCHRAYKQNYRKANLERIREYDRMWHRLQQERRGKKVVPIRPEIEERYRLPAGPFVAWLNEYMRVRKLESGADAAVDLGLHPRRVTEYLRGATSHVTLDNVDRALMNAAVEVDVNGKTVFTIEDLYGDVLGEEAA